MIRCLRPLRFAPGLILASALLSGCGPAMQEAAHDSTASQGSSSAVLDPVPGGEAPSSTTATCRDLEPVYDPRVDNGPLSVVERTVIIEPGGVRYQVDLDDPACQALPKVGRLVAQVKAQLRADQKSECRGMVAELKALTPAQLSDPDATIAGPKGSRQVSAVVDYAHSLCDRLGITVPHG